MTSIWAHRGASVDAPENTIPAFELAFQQGADGIELDVQRSLDGVLVVCHDELIDRTSDGSGAIVEMTLEQLRHHDFSNGRSGFTGVTIPMLVEVLELVRGTDRVVNIELKNSVVRYPGMEEQVDKMLTEFGLTDQVWYSSFNHLSLHHLAELGSRVGRGVLYVEPMAQPWVYATRLGATALHPLVGTVNAELIASAHQAGVQVHPWTVDDPQAIATLAAAGVDAVITNLPQVARRTLDAL